MNSIRSKVLTLIISSIIVVASLAGFLVMSKTLTTYEIEIEEELLVQVKNNGIHFDQEIEDVEETAESMERLVVSLLDIKAYKNDPNYVHDFVELIDPSIERFAKEMSQSLSAYVFFGPEIHNEVNDVWYADLEKNGLSERQSKLDLSYYDTITESKDWYFVPKRRLEPNWTKPYDGNLDFDANVIFVSYTIPIVIDHQFLGVVGSDYYYEDLLKIVSEYSFSETGSAMLFNQNAEVLIQPENNLFPHGNIDFWLKQKLLYNDEGLLEVGSNNQWYMTFTKLKNGWIYAEMVSKEDLLKWYYDLRLILIVLVSVLIVFIIAVSIKTVKMIVNPLILLTSTVGVISNGDYDVRIEKNLLLKADETGLLARSIEKLRLIQKSNYEELREQNASLESKVQERTENLIASHETLEKSLEHNRLEKSRLVELNQTLEEAVEKMKKTQLHLIESEKSASLSMITTKMAHEFNTPIGSFLTLLTYLKKEKDKLIHKVNNDELSEKNASKFMRDFNRCYMMIYEQLEELSTIIVRFKELDTMKNTPIHIQINVKEYVQFILQSLSYYNQLEVKFDCPDDMIIDVDTGKFSQIFIQIIDNAYHHAYDRNHTRIDIEIKKSSILEIMFRDYGKGISNELIKDIFVPYYTHQLNTMGTGLGLNIVYNIVTKFFGGHISCESSNEGTLFHVMINVDK